MSLAKKISDDVKSALKGGDKKKLSIARYVYSELKNFLIKENLDSSMQAMLDSFKSEDFKEGVSHFVEKREAKFTGK